MGRGREALKKSSLRALFCVELLMGSSRGKDAPEPRLTGEAGRSSPGEDVPLSPAVNLWNLDGLEARGMAGDGGALT